MMGRKSNFAAGMAVTWLAMNTAPAWAEIWPNTHEVHGYAGMLWGDEIVDITLSGSRPKLDDHVVYGIRWAYHVTDTWGVEASWGYSPTAVVLAARRDVGLDLTTLDLAFMYHFHRGTRWLPYWHAGAGFAWAKLEAPAIGTKADGEIAGFNDGSGFTLNAGGGVKYFATDKLVIRLDTRYRYLDGLTNRYATSLDTWEATIGFGWRF